MLVISILFCFPSDRFNSKNRKIPPPQGDRGRIHFAVPPLIRRPLAKTASFLRCNGRSRARLLVRSAFRRSGAGSEGYSPPVSLPLPPCRGFSLRSARRLLDLFIAVLGSILADGFQIVNLLTAQFLLLAVKIPLFPASARIKTLIRALSFTVAVLTVTALSPFAISSLVAPDSLCT